MKVALYAADLHYGNGVVLHTASSGTVSKLQSLFLRLNDGTHRAVGEVRINIAYLNGYSAEQIVADTLRVINDVNWEESPEALLQTMPSWARHASMPARCLIDCALHDLVARTAGVPLSQWLSGRSDTPTAWPTNQTLFWSPFHVFLRQAEAYVERGFRDLKVRVAVGEFSEDLRRLGALRDRFGDGIKLAADANAQWRPDEAPARLMALAPFELAYVEQPMASVSPSDLVALADRSPMPLMLDEGLRNEADVAELCRLRHDRLWAHLKLVKLGGIGPTVTAARQLAASNVKFMVGQMNEGAAATAATLHVACAVSPAFAELYGADGLSDDPVTGLTYADGHVVVKHVSGIGVESNFSHAKPIWSLQ